MCYPLCFLCLVIILIHLNNNIVIQKCLRELSFLVIALLDNSKSTQAHYVNLNMRCLYLDTTIISHKVYSLVSTLKQHCKKLQNCMTKFGFNNNNNNNNNKNSKSLSELRIDHGTFSTADWCVTCGPQRKLNIYFVVKLLTCINVMGRNIN